MGLFGKKEKIPEKVTVQFYDGDLPGFVCNLPCSLQLTDDAILLTKANPLVEARLDRQRVLSIDIFMQENQYMAKYKGTNITTTKCKSIPKHYYVINYLDKNGDSKHIDFWGVSSETSKMMKIRTKIAENQQSSSYEI